MKKHSYKIGLLRYIKITLILVWVLLGNSTHAQGTLLTVISNPKGCPAGISASEMKSIFKGEKQRWKSGDKIQIALMKANTPVGKNVCESVYAMSEDELKKYWLGLVFQGKAEAPSTFSSISDLKAFVAENPGAIGIIDQAPPASGLQVVLIDGQKSF